MYIHCCAKEVESSFSNRKAFNFTTRSHTLHWTQMADGHLGLGSNVQHGPVDFKVCDWPPETRC